MTCHYTDSLDGITADMLTGFFSHWQHPPSPRKHLRMLCGSTHLVLAIDDDDQRVIGFISAMADGAHAAFITELEVLPKWRGRGIGSELVRRLLDALSEYPCIDLMCDPDLQPFYARFGMRPYAGMILRDRSRPGPPGLPGSPGPSNP